MNTQPEDIHLLATRGFASGEPVPGYWISGRKTGLAHGADYDESRDHELFEADTCLVGCPLSGNMQSVSICRKCPMFKGIGKLEIRPGARAATIQEKYRILCKHPYPRRLFPHNHAPPTDYAAVADIMHRQKHPNQETPEAVTERSLFIEEGHAVNCPRARAKVGTWTVKNAPCLTCPEFKGVRQLETKDCHGNVKPGLMAADCAAAAALEIEVLADVPIEGMF